MSTNYDHKEVEPKWIKAWLEADLYKTRIDESKPRSKRFSIALPPPNVTGELHMGHALGGTIQDILIRYHRMLGHDVLWQIGTDHAGIGTQLVVEKDLKKQGIDKHSLTREEFIDKVKAWKEIYGNKIIEQMKTLAFSPDYSRCRYTMDDDYSKIVQETFLEYFNKGLIYRGERLVNWCPHCKTSLSDLEVEKKESKKKLYKIGYIVYKESETKSDQTITLDSKHYAATEEQIVVATSRPETMFGDAAVAINPKDERFAKYIADFASVRLRIPFTDVLIPLVLDDQVKLDFGTGALKVTPAHDKNDEQIAKRQGLPYINIFDEDGRLLASADDKPSCGYNRIPDWLRGVDRYKARDLVVEKLQADSDASSLCEISEYAGELEAHDRCATEIEPYLSKQWYVNMKSLAELAIKTVFDDKRTQFVPERYADPYRVWLDNIQDWCISRQIWWGHRIPVTIEGVQDPDVLDTWFSSALWPYATLKDDPKVFKHFYPTNVLATAREIINLWVSRMIYSSEYFEGVEPFKDVLIHPVVQTPDGKRMSKSKGNAIDPLELVELYGADASRMWYASVGVYGNQDVKFPGKQDKATKKWSSDTIEQYRKFANKLFNAAKFVSMQLGEGFKATNIADLKDLRSPDIWILSKFNNLVKELEHDYEIYDFSAVQSKIYNFIWFSFCDWYIELSKIDTSETQKQVLYYVLEGSLRLLHPIMPCITEEIWQSLLSLSKPYAFSEQQGLNSPSLFAKSKATISFAAYPSFNQDLDNILSAEAFKQMEFTIELVSALRNSRQTLGISWSNPIDLYIDALYSFEQESIKNNANYIRSIAKVKEIKFTKEAASKPLSIVIVGNAKIQIPLAGIVDIAKIKENIDRKITALQKDIGGLEQRLNSESFVANAAPEKLAETKAALDNLLAQKEIYMLELLDLRVV